MDSRSKAAEADPEEGLLRWAEEVFSGSWPASSRESSGILLKRADSNSATVGPKLVLLAVELEPQHHCVITQLYSANSLVLQVTLQESLLEEQFQRWPSSSFRRLL